MSEKHQPLDGQTVTDITSINHNFSYRMCTSVIDLSSLPDNSCKHLLDLKFEYGKDRQIQSRIRAIYADQKVILEEELNEWFEESNSALVNDVIDFIKKSLGKNADQAVMGPKLVFPAYILIGWQAADYLRIVDLLQNKALQKFKALQAARISANITKRAHALQVVDQVSDAKQLLVIVEQAETLENQVMASIVRSLYNKLNEGRLSKAMILFCMSTGAKAISQMIPLDSASTMNPMRFIVRKHSEVELQLEDWLMRSEKKYFKFSHADLNNIYNEFIERNPSFSYLQYICQYAIYNHCMSRLCSALLGTTAKELTGILSLHERIVEEIKGLESIRLANPRLKWSDKAAVAKYCLDQIKYSKTYHTFIVDQIQYYFKLLRDETKETFPADASDIYHELMIHDDLSKSNDMVEAILNIRKFGHEALLKRLETSSETYQSVPKEIDPENDIFVQLSIVKEKVRNNDECSKLKTELSNKLLRHLQLMKNPMKLPLAEIIYFNHSNHLKGRLSPTQRCGFTRHSMDETHFGILLQLITDNPEEISLHDLFNDYLQVITERKPNLTSVKPPPGAEPIMKHTPKKSRRETATSKSVRVDGEPDEGLIKALFIDYIQTLVHQGIVSMDTRGSKRGIIRKTTWPCIFNLDLAQ